MALSLVGKGGSGGRHGWLTSQREAEEQGKAKGTFSLTFTVLTLNSGFYIQMGSCTLSHTVYQTSLMAQTKNLPAMREVWARSLGQEDLLEKGMATHSSILAWRSPWTKEPGGLQSRVAESD